MAPYVSVRLFVFQEGYFMKKFKIIDSHCHIFPDNIAQKATDSIDTFYQISESGVINECGFVGNTKSLINQCNLSGVNKCLVTSVATTPHHAQSINEFIAEEVNLYPDRFIGFGSLHPESKTLTEDVEHLIELILLYLIISCLEVSLQLIKVFSTNTSLYQCL
jgi:Tat protein secretion system quality control protein TatD with DNase activity